MQLAAAERKVTVSVREFAEFRTAASDKRMSREGYWRAQLGNTWHQKLREQVTQRNPETQFEVPIETHCRHAGWTFRMRGRIDQLLAASEHIKLCEIKTLSLALPVDESELEKNYPHAFNQIATYLALAALLPEYQDKQLSGQLLFVDITHGILQSVDIDGHTAGARFRAQLDAWLPFLEDTWHSKMRIQSLNFEPAFATPRPGQQETQADIQAATHQHNTILFEAPTGFGKTGTLLEFALRELKSGRYQRAIYLTGKSTGQIQAIHQIRHMVPEKGRLRYFQLRNKREHTNNCTLHGCDAINSCADSLVCNRLSAPLQPDELFTEGTLSLDDICSLSTTTQICPYELSRLALGCAEVWLCDYNYVFAPDNQGVLFNQPGFAPQQTLLIIDEAHNLPSRIHDIHSALVSQEEAMIAESELAHLTLPAKFRIAWTQWVQYLGSIQPSGQLDLNFSYELHERVAELTQLLNRTAINYDLLTAFTRDHLLAFHRLHSILTNDAIETLLWSAKPGQLRVNCLEAAHETASIIAQFATTIFMSATLSPVDLFLKKIGLDATLTPVVTAYTPWRDNAYQVAVDTRVDTRLKTRAAYYNHTAQTILHITDHTTAPVVVFFPSYRYAETIATYVKTANPYTHICMQPRAVDLNGQMRFVEESLLSAHALFFVLGSSFSESIDHLGGKIEYAMVVGPALPEVNPIQNANLQKFEHLGKAEAFRRTYQLPAMQKINQALGRLVRAPGQRARVLLHCRRFAEPSYQQLLNPEYRYSMAIGNDRALANWLSSREHIAD